MGFPLPAASKPNPMAQCLSSPREKLLLEAGSSHLTGPQRRAGAALPLSTGISGVLEGSVCPNILGLALGISSLSRGYRTQISGLWQYLFLSEVRRSISVKVRMT